MKLGILQCDKVSPMFMSEHGQYPEMFKNLLSPVDLDMEFLVFDVESGQFPKHIDEADAYLITGSRHGANDGYDWIEQLEEFVRALNQASKKIIGICFGHQLIAKALGGKVIKSPKGWGVGMSVNQMIKYKPWMSPYQAELNILVSHQDQVVELPFEAELLAQSGFCENYMMQIGDNILTIQGHPEFTKAYSLALMVSREDTISELEFEKGKESLKLRGDDYVFAQWVIHFLKF